MVKGAIEPISSVRLILSYNPAIFEVTSVKEGQFDLFESKTDNKKWKVNIVGHQIGIEELREDFKIADITPSEEEGVPKTTPTLTPTTTPVLPSPSPSPSPSPITTTTSTSNTPYSPPGSKER